MTTYPLAAGLAASGEEINPIVPAPAEIIIGFIAFGLLLWVWIFVIVGLASLRRAG